MSLIDYKDSERLGWYREKVFSGALEIEKALGWKLRTYFFPKANIQASIFYLSIINANHFTFERKIALYQQIPYFKKLKNYKKSINSLRFIQKLRNELAHWELLEFNINKEEFVIYSPITFKKRKLDKKLIEDFMVHDKFLLKFFGWNYTLENKYGIKYRNTLSEGNKRNAEIREFARLLSKYPKIK